MSPAVFLAYQVLPTLLAWISTTYWIKLCWISHRNKSGLRSLLPVKENSAPSDPGVAIEEGLPPDEERKEDSNSNSCHLSVEPPGDEDDPMSSREQRLRNNLLNRVSYIVTSPVPFLGCAMLIFMIVLIFLNFMPISASVSITAVLLVLLLVLSNYWTRSPIWVREDGLELPKSHKQRIDSLTDFFEQLFLSVGTHT